MRVQIRILPKGQEMVGKQIGSYRIVEKIGQGGMGTVYKGIHTKLEQEVAIKVLSSQFSQDLYMRERFFKEAKIQAKFSHPNVVNILNYLEDGENIFLVMEYVNGETIENWLKRDGKLPIEKAITTSLSVLEALDFMHSKGIVHRDIKPSNIMFTDKGHVKVTDFGIAKVIGEKGHTKTGITGTYRYMSPEQILGEETGVTSDIYSFGITLYEMVTGMVPFSGDSEYKIMKGHLEDQPLPPWEINSKVSEEVGSVILKTLNKNPKDRYQKAKEVAENLRKAIKEQKEAMLLPQILTTDGSWEIPIPSFNLDERQSLILGSLGIGLLIIILILMWPQSLPKKSITSVPPTGSIQSELGLGFDIPLSENITLEYLSTKLERAAKSEDTRVEKQLSKISVGKEKTSSVKRGIGRKSQREISKKDEKASSRGIREKGNQDANNELKDILRRTLLLPQP
jgi:serine/threonine protein kinase